LNPSSNDKACACCFTACFACRAIRDGRGEQDARATNRMASLSQHYAASAAFLSLKVNELKEVCISAGLPRTGRKADLQQRILLAMRDGNRVQLALEQLLGGRRPVSSPASLAPLGKPLMAMPATGAAAAYMSHPLPAGVAHSQPAGSATALDVPVDPFLPPAEPAGAGPWSSVVRGAMPARFRVVLPTDIYQRLIEPSAKLQLVVRSFKTDQRFQMTDQRYHRWPLGSVVHLNRFPLAVHQVPPAWDGVVFKDRKLDQPLVVPAANLRPGPNELELHGQDSQNHVLVAQLCVPTSVDVVRLGVERDGTLGFDECRTRMLMMFGGGGAKEEEDDDDLIQSSVRLSLRCPLSYTRIGVPVRSVECRHLECFDLASYLEMANVTKPAKWKCPMCNKDATPALLRVDSWVAWVLQAALPKAADVQVAPDGTVSESVATTPRKRKQPEPSGMGGAGGGSSSGGGGGAGYNGGAGSSTAAAEPVVIGLDDDDDAEAGAPGPSSASGGGYHPPGDEEDNPICLDDD